MCIDRYTLRIACVVGLMGAGMLDGSTAWAAGGMDWRLNVAKEVWVLREPVVVSVTLSNASTDTQEVNVAIGPGRGFVDYEIGRNGRDFEAIPSCEIADPIARKLSLAHGERIVCDSVLYLNCDARKILFDDVGEYQVRVKYRDEHGKERYSNVVTIKIQSPASRVDEETCRLLEDRQIQFVLGGGELASQTAFQTVSNIASGSSVYAPYAAHALGAISARRVVLRLADTTGLPDILGMERTNLTEAVRLLQKADRDGFPLRCEVVYNQALLNIGLDQYERAWEHLDRLQREFPNSTVTRSLQRNRRMRFTRDEARQKDQQFASRREKDESSKKMQAAFAVSGERPKVEAAIRQFMAAHREGRIEECAGMMTEDFLRAGSMDRTKSLAKMRKEFEKLKGKKLDAEPTFDSVTTDGTNVTVAISVVYRLAGEERSQKESYTLRQEQGQWKISRQAVTYSEPPPGFPPHPPSPKQ